VTSPQRVIRLVLSALLVTVVAASPEARGTGGHASGHWSGSHAGTSGGHASKAKKSKHSTSEAAAATGTSNVPARQSWPHRAERSREASI
jgi:hypothetical protein